MNTLLIALTIFGVVLSDREDFQRGKGGHHGPPPPPFLKGLNATVRKEYNEIMRQKNETIAQQKEKIQEWARKYELENQVQEFESNLTEHKKELQKNVTELIASLPAVNEKLVNIMNDENQTPLQMKEAMNDLKNQSRKVRSHQYLGGLALDLTNITRK
ncbi:hypothetical protein OESDEN_22314 [Oesophagostomum dentatum]|uniref:SXP/RAL-2 family protein Ani s 5-like cation-binding domain-containing protein n=1 Tax=Oesophagostomum dentatum TaxID=61180 RepID=A0A0B1S2F8_OESDE|nr:hypothetical protein OESDEN_22314 [Oesophagostomum dentatum]